MADDVAIRVSRVSKAFKLPHEKQNSIKGLFVSMFRGRRTYERQQVLKDVSFDIKKGEFFGIVGRNGSGKSTLLKLLSGIYAPDKGRITVNGKLTPFIELGVGFNPELTGRENVFLNGALLGFNRAEMEAMYKEIVEFAELEKFMDQKLKNYSSGMQVRLAFSIAIRSKSEILVLDEVLAVGDAAFQQKCEDYFHKAKREKRTVVLVSHSMKSVEEFCSRALLIDNGEVVDIGDPEDIALQYKQINLETTNQELARGGDTDASGQVKIDSIYTTNQGDKKESIFSPKDTISVSLSFTPVDNISSVAVSMRCYGPGMPALIANDTRHQGIPLEPKSNKPIKLKWSFPAVLNDGVYSIGLKIYNPETSQVYIKNLDLLKFEIKGWAHPYHILQIKDDLDLIKLKP